MELEIKRTSITRLKQFCITHFQYSYCSLLEIKRTSITRLKRSISTSYKSTGISYLKSKEPRLRDWNITHSSLPFAHFLSAWNQKNLDYEIETIVRIAGIDITDYTWNQKNLDYEIETWLAGTTEWQVPALEIKRTSITRLKRVGLRGVAAFKFS